MCFNKTPLNLTTFIAFGFLFFSQAADCKVFMTLPEAMEQAFPKKKGCIVTPESRYLTDEQKTKAQVLAGTPAQSSLVVRHKAVCEGQLAALIYTDTHRVRTKSETVMVVVKPNHQVARVETLSFDEPLDYIPRAEWYGTFQNVRLDPDLEVKRKIPFVTGASLTSSATVQASRRVLALDEILGH